MTTAQRFVVTGGAGFIGSHLVTHLVESGHEVVVLDDFSTGRRENLAAVQDRITIVEGSITDPRVCVSAFRGAQYVLHEAAIPSVARSVDDPVGTHEANVTGTLNVLVAAREAGVRRVVFAASAAAYGDNVEMPRREELPPRPLSPYAAHKVAGEGYLRAFHTAFGLETVALRYFNVFGPRQNARSHYASAIPKFITAALAGEGPTIFGDGEQTRDFVYVGNVVHANVLACAAPADALGQVFNVGSGERITINDLWRTIREIVGCEADASHGPPRPGDVRDSLASLERSRSVLGYDVIVPAREGLRRTIEHYAATSESAAGAH